MSSSLPSVDSAGLQVKIINPDARFEEIYPMPDAWRAAVMAEEEEAIARGP